MRSEQRKRAHALADSPICPQANTAPAESRARNLRTEVVVSALPDTLPGMTHTTTTDIHTLALATDTALAALESEAFNANRKWANAYATLHRIAGHTQDRRGAWSGTRNAARAYVAPESYNLHRQQEARAAADAADAEIARIREDMQPLAALFVEHRWSRFFLVTSSAGHVHSHMGCHTCLSSTTFAWLPELSGMTEADAVAAHGEILCSVCFPSAPVEWTNGTSKASKIAAEERAAAKAEREAKRIAKAATVDGSELVVTDKYGRKEYFKTAVAARNWAISELRDARYYGDRITAEQMVALHASVATVALALAAKTGETPDAITAKMVKTASKD